jgi:iduronate 2-sulfatase
MGAALLGQAKRPPNVLLIVSDDLTSTVLGCYGNKLVKTPNIDALARRGVRFENAYCQFPLCGPSRASFLTGMRPETTQVKANDIDFRKFHPDVVTLPQLFKNSGVYSAREGKMFHMNVPMEVGKPRFQDEASWNHNGSPQGMEDNSPGELHKMTPKSGRGVKMDWMEVADAKGQADEDAATRAISLLDGHGKDPFFLGLGFVRPHVPLVAPAKFFDLYPLSQCKPVAVPPGDEEDISPLFRNMRKDIWNNMDMTEAEIRQGLRAYYASTSFMDDQMGRVLRALDEKKLRDNTVIAFTSDHGWHLGEHNRWQKRSLMEESAKVPLIVCDPRRRVRGKTSRAMVEMVDIYPTLAELGGLTKPGHLEGQSFAPLLDNPTRRWKGAAFTEMSDGKLKGISARTPGYRFIEWREGDGEPQEELYDHRKDPREITNLAKTNTAMLSEARRVMAAGWKGARV